MNALLNKASKVLAEIDVRVLPAGLAVAVQQLKKEIDDGERVTEEKAQPKKVAKKKVTKKTAKKKAAKKK